MSKEPTTIGVLVASASPHTFSGQFFENMLLSKVIAESGAGVKVYAGPTSKLYSQVLYYDYVGEGRYTSTEQFFMYPDKVADYHKLMHAGAVTKTWEELEPILLENTSAHRIDYVPYTSREFKEKVDAARDACWRQHSGDPELWPLQHDSYQRRKNQCFTAIKILCGCFPEYEEQLTAPGLSYINIKSNFDRREQARWDTFSFTSTGYICWLDKLSRTAILVTPRGKIEFARIRGPKGKTKWKKLPASCSTTGNIFMWHMLYCILNESGSIFDFATETSPQQGRAAMLESLEAAIDEDYCVMSHPADGSISDFVALVARKVYLREVELENWLLKGMGII